jgi:aminoglycoside phosphotransferase (APT) family kinase protein
MITIDEKLVRQLLESQFPQWAHLPLWQIVPGGWDNKTFRLGEHMLVRMPRDEQYGAQVEKEQLWLPKLAASLKTPIPVPLGRGNPCDAYPFRWSIYRWLDGEVASPARIRDLREFATDLAEFLAALERVDATGGPVAGPHSFFRGGALKQYDTEIRQAIGALKEQIDTDLATVVWNAALATTWQALPVWVHGDIGLGNLLVQDGRLCAVIDFGQLAIGDPACDLAIAWTLFEDESRKAFRERLRLDEDTWARGRGWALWKAAILAAGLAESNAVEAADPWRVIHAVLADFCG